MGKEVFSGNGLFWRFFFFPGERGCGGFWETEFFLAVGEGGEEGREGGGCGRKRIFFGGKEEGREGEAGACEKNRG